MRLFVYQVAVHPIDVTSFDDGEKQYLRGHYWRVSTLGPQGQEIEWDTTGPQPTIGDYLERDVERLEYNETVVAWVVHE